MKDCPFCNIHLEKDKILEERDSVMVIFGNPRLMRGHLLVIPKRHVEKFSQLTKEERTELLETTIEFQEKILSELAGGCDIRQNYRPFQKQSKFRVPHLHIHLQPREPYDQLYEECQVYETDIFKEALDEEVEEVSKVLK